MKKAIVFVIFCFIVAGALVFSGIIGTKVEAAPSCTQWMKQTNGCYWRTCVDDRGHQYCEQCCGKSCGRVSCR